MKNRGNTATWTIALEAIVITLLKRQAAGLDSAGKGALASEILTGVGASADEIAALASVTGRPTLNADQARAAAAHIKSVGTDLVKDFLKEAVDVDLSAPKT